MTIDEGKVKYDYSKAFKILAEAVDETNSSKVTKTEDFNSQTFEPNEKADNTAQTGDLLPSRPTWLPKPRISIQADFSTILQTFQNLSYIGELRQRWFEIKKLLKGELRDDVPSTVSAT